jgi:hypothetical protein
MLSGATLTRWVSGEIRQGRRGELGISGFSVRTTCGADSLHVELFRGARPIHDDDRLVAVTIGGPTLSGNLASSDPVAGVGPSVNTPVVREVVEDWFRRRGHPTQRELDDAAHGSAAFAHSPAGNCVSR